MRGTVKLGREVQVPWIAGKMSETKGDEYLGECGRGGTMVALRGCMLCLPRSLGALTISVSILLCGRAAAQSPGRVAAQSPGRAGETSTPPGTSTPPAKQARTRDLA